jgi:beta-glucanase (GH16 family)
MVPQSIAAIILLSAMAALADPPPGFRWTQTFGDDFDGTAVDLKKWKPQFFGCHVINGELQAYQPGNVSVSDGKLCLVARREQCSYAYCGQPGIVKDYSSGCAISEGKFAQRYGYWEGRFVFPRVRGSWPAFWLLSQNESGKMAGWPPEVDIFDAVDLGDGPLNDLPWGIYCGSNYPNPGGNVSLCTGNRAPLSSDMSVNYHTAGFLWTPDSAAFYVDDVRVRNKSGQTEAAYRGGTQWTYPMYMLVNMALNPNVGATYANLPCTTKVDWVRVYAQAPLPADNTPPTLAPSGFTAQALEDTKIRLSWQRLADAADPETGIKSYALYQNGVKIIDTRDIVDTVIGLTESTAYTFAVAALNWRDLEGPRASVTATTLADTVKPKIAFAFARDSMHLVVHFSEPVQKNSAETIANYSLTGGIMVVSAVLDAAGREVLLTTSRISTGTSVSLTASKISDLAKAPNTSASTFPIRYPAVRGVLAKYYERNYACVLPGPQELEALVPQKQTVLPGFSVATTAISRIHNFEMLYSSYLLVPAAGTHVYRLAACDGAALYLDGQKIIDNGGCHPRVEMQSAPITLEAGAYPIKVVYGDSAGSPTMLLTDSIVGGRRQFIADSSLLILENITAVSARPAVARNGAASGLRVLQYSSGARKSHIEFSFMGVGENAEEISAKIYDMRGSLVSIRHPDPLIAGSNCLSLGDHQLKPGHYVCSVRAGGRVLQAPFMVAQ